MLFTRNGNEMVRDGLGRMIDLSLRMLGGEIADKRTYFHH